MKRFVMWTWLCAAVFFLFISCPLDTIPSEYTVVIMASPAAGGTAGMAPDADRFPAGESVTIEAAANPGYRFAHWEGDAETDGNPQVITVNDDLAIIAVFAEIAPGTPTYTVAATVDPADSGSVTRSPDLADYPEGTSVELMAAPAATYAFSGWGGDLSGLDNPVTVIMNSNVSVTAQFSLLPEYPLVVDVSPSGTGTVSRSPSASVYVEGTVVELTATPAPEFVFSGWSGDLAGTDNPATVTMDGNRSVTAEFVLAGPPDTYEPNDSIDDYANLGTVARGGGEYSYTANVLPEGDVDFYRFYAEEGSTAGCWVGTPQHYTITVRLSPPHPKDYDLYVYDDAGTLLGSSKLGGSSVDQVTIDWDGVCGYDDSQYFRIEVRPWTGNWGCDDYTLTIQIP